MGDKHKIVPPPRQRHLERRILDEARHTLGLVLWQSLRHVRDWAETAPESRAALFPPETPAWVAQKQVEARAQAPELSAALDRFWLLARAPLAAAAHELADACESVSAWAEERGFSETAIEFAEAAAVVATEDPRRANLAGRVNRGAADFARAEAWFERGIGLARARKNRVEYTRGHLGYGILCKELGRVGCARRHFNTASMVAMKEGYEWLAAEVQHDLFALLIVRGHYAEAERHARKALEWYPKHHRRFPFFVADLAFLLVCQRHFTPAAALLGEFVRAVRGPTEQVLGLSLLVRALAGAGQRDAFERTRRRLQKALARDTTWEPAARVNLAEADRSAGWWESAEANARAALELASARLDTEPARLATRLLTQIAKRAPAPAEVPRHDEPFRALVEAARKRLAEWMPGRCGRRPTLSREEWAA